MSSHLQLLVVVQNQLVVIRETTDYDPTHFEGFLFGPLKLNSVQEEHPSKYPYPGSVPDEILKTGDSFDSWKMFRVWKNV